MPILDDMCPIRSFQIKNHRPDWMTAELIEQIKDRDYFYDKAKRDRTKDSWIIAKHLRNITNANMRQAKREFILEELNDYDNKGNSRKEILLKEGWKKVDRKEVAHYINDYFMNIGKVASPKNMGLPDKVEEVSDEIEGWELTGFSIEEVLKVVKEINVSKSSGLTNISSFVVKEVFTTLISQTCYMMNLSVKTSIFPKAWKEASVIPIPKRPISLLPLPGKIHKQVAGFIEEDSLLSCNQHGFRKEHSTIHSIAQVTDYIKKNSDRGLPTIATFVDFRKAFDCVQHPILLEKLAALGLHKSVTCWFKSYLSERYQRVLANNVRSSSQIITQGVPQGSVLGPLFYILYANDIMNTVKSCNMALYADDTVLYTANPTFDTSIVKMRSDMQALSNWCGINGIRMNLDKTKIMLFGNSKRLKALPKVNLDVDGVTIQTVTSYKYLGVTLDSQLNFAKHVNKTLSGASLKLKQFCRMRSFLNTKAATLVYDPPVY